MSTLEKFGILVILILVVVIGVVAVWGVGGGEDGVNPFDAGLGGVADAPVDDPVPPASDPLPWPDAGVSREPVPPATDPVPPPPVNTPVTPPTAGLTPTPPSSGRTHTVRKGETLSAIAQQYLGDRNKWKAIRDANPGVDPRTLRIGQVLRIPEGGAPVATNPAPTTPPVKGLLTPRGPNPDDGPSMEPRPSAGGTEYEVRKGDTLSAIAAEFYGSSSKYYRILEANPGLDPLKLRPGMRIVVPAAE